MTPDESYSALTLRDQSVPIVSLTTPMAFHYAETRTQKQVINGVTKKAFFLLRRVAINHDPSGLELRFTNYNTVYREK